MEDCKMKTRSRKSTEADNLLDALGGYERWGIELLNRFNETSEPVEGIDGSIGLPVQGEWRFFNQEDEADGDNLFKAAILFHSLDDARQLIEEIQESASPELAFRLASYCMRVANYAIDLGFVTDDIWQLGEARIAHAEMMRKRKKVADGERRQEKHNRAIEAMRLVKHKFPTATHDDYVGFLKNKAAEHLGISRDTVDRWLKPPEEQ
jgi:hypothetical protein